MSFWIHWRGEHSNRTYAQIYEVGDGINFPVAPDRYGPFPTKEEAIKAAEKRGLTLTSLQDLQKK